MYEQKALSIDLSSGYYRVDRIQDPDILGPVDYGLKQWRKKGALCFGGGPFMGSILPGSNRLVFAGYSPCWDGFFISTMGGAAKTFDNVGVDYVSLEGRCVAPSVLVLRRERQEEVSVELTAIDPVSIWNDGPAGENGFYALQQYLWDRYAESFSNPPRVLAVGPAALTTDFGAIGSSKTSNRGLTTVDCWAGRGGLGSRMARHHNLFGIVFGGSHIGTDLKDRKLADAYFKRRYEMRMVIKDKMSTRKYRYDPELETGGTLGVNFTKLKDRLFFFNYRSVNWPLQERLELHDKLIVQHYLKQFNEETIAEKSFSHCGEVCTAVCKKMWGRYKKDYEPYQAIGPNCGIVDQRAAEKAVGLCDAMGFDSIQVGGVLSWLLDLLDSGLVEPEQLGVSAKPSFHREGFSAESDSDLNASIVCELVEQIASTRGNLDFSRGARVAARQLGAKTGKTREVLDRLIVNCSSERGWMVPNQYWVPGMFSPMPIMGKYFEYYGDDFVPPRTLGVFNAERMAAELMLDNMGFCRFHRDWAEELVPEVFNDFWSEDVDMPSHHLNLARRINAHNTSMFWESSRITDLHHQFLRRKAEEGVQRAELDEWLKRFEQDAQQAARDFWYEIRKGVDQTLEER